MTRQQSVRRAAAALVVGGACAALAVLVGPAPAAGGDRAMQPPGDLYAVTGTDDPARRRIREGVGLRTHERHGGPARWPHPGGRTRATP